jgi:hypothetical protein
VLVADCRGPGQAGVAREPAPTQVHEGGVAQYPEGRVGVRWLAMLVRIARVVNRPVQ